MRSAATLLPFSASLRITCLLIQMFMLAESYRHTFEMPAPDEIERALQDDMEDLRVSREKMEPARRPAADRMMARREVATPDLRSAMGLLLNALAYTARACRCAMAQPT